MKRSKWADENAQRFGWQAGDIEIEDPFDPDLDPLAAPDPEQEDEEE